MAFAEVWQGLELVQDDSSVKTNGDDVMGPVDDVDVENPLAEPFAVVLLVVELLADTELTDDDEGFWELPLVLVGSDNAVELGSVTTDVEAVVVAKVTDGRAERQVQTA